MKPIASSPTATHLRTDSCTRATRRGSASTSTSPWQRNIHMSAHICRSTGEPTARYTVGEELKRVSTARLMRAFLHMCGQVRTAIIYSGKEISAYVPRPTRRSHSGGHRFDPVQLHQIHSIATRTG